MKDCKGCGLMFIPQRAEDQYCGMCSARRRRRNQPIDLWLQWSGRD